MIAETFAESPHSELFPPGSERRSRRAANVGATVIHRLFMPPIENLNDQDVTDRRHQ